MWLFLLACGEPGPTEPPEVTPAPEPVEDVAPVVVPDEVAMRHILVSHEEAAATPAARSREDALKRATEIRARIVAGEDMRDLASTMSDDMGTRKRGGWLGVGDEGAWVPEFEKAAFALEVGELSEPVETEFGFHVMRREDHTPVQLKHLVVRYRLSPVPKYGEAPDRSLDDAIAMAEAARARIVAGEEFEDVARDVSEGPYAEFGGDLGEFLRGELGPEVDAIIDDVPPGELSQVYTTAHGAHVILRVE